ncbi:hypothetical protein [Devosia sp. SD17-2]|uniref:hypothetical protein n=1 Tax=Devosia sp. SD17-2 TaxID=2976459 RepID=UPI0023D7D11B|nr:hypothetical protein [Devosia sp. SD17-2]WEJ32681.1 hypothetical protein NYQ88_17630 [Devosia sp. SD17-2]
MVFESLRAQAGAANALAPMQIAQHTFFTAKEKIELLNQLKAEVTGANAEGDDLGFSPEEIDAAIAHVREGVADGVGSETVFKGDF